MGKGRLVIGVVLELEKKNKDLHVVITNKCVTKYIQRAERTDRSASNT